MDFQGFDAYEKSVNKTGNSTVFMAQDGEGDFLVIMGEKPENIQAQGFEGEKLPGDAFKAPLTHKNAIALRKLFPFTAPSRVLGKERSFGVGDRLGLATAGHIRLFTQYDAYPVFAQQSIRELDLTGRNYEEVLDVVSFAVFREGFTKEWGADGDHLKSAKDVENALSLGFTMITLDCSEHIKNDINDTNAPPLAQNYAEKYLGKKFDAGEGLVLSFSEDELAKITAIYGGAIEFAKSIYKQFFEGGKYQADFEISIDETLTPTTPLQHYFVARELSDAGVVFATMAPRFCGEFQKGVDYIGDLAQFEKEIKAHAIIARHFKYKLSIHSGSDKFAVFPLIGSAAEGVFHVKTAGTNWLEAMRVVALKDPALYREVHQYALEAFSEARKYYHVTTDITKIPALDKLTDADLPGLFEQNDSRQLIHITYGLILSKKDGGGANAGGVNGGAAFKERLYKFWKENAEEYAQALEKHIGKHLDLLGVKKHK